MQSKHENTTKNIPLDSMPGTQLGVIDLTKAQRIAEGGTHVLYRFKDAPYVVKLMKQNPTPSELEQLENKYAVLYDCFDKNDKLRCIREQHKTLNVLLPGKEPQRRALSIVPYENCFKAKVKFDFKIEPAELDPYLVEHNLALFAKANKALLCEATPECQFNLNDYISIDTRIGAILQRLDSDLELREIMIEFLTHYRDFYQRTNIILDAMGFENILFFKDEQDHWQFKIGSAIKHDTGNYTRELYRAIHAEKPVEMNFVNFTHTYFSPANIRAVNACALKLGLGPVIHDIAIDTNDLLRISRELPVAERMLAYARHGDFETMNTILLDNKAQLNFSLRDFWAYALIADEFIKHGHPPKTLGNYLNLVSELSVILPEDKDEAKRVIEAKMDIVQRRNVHHKKMMLHHELLTYVGFWSSVETDETAATTTEEPNTYLCS